MPNSSIEITPLERKDVKIVHDLAHIIWPPTFKDILIPQQIDYMLELMYTEESLKSQIDEGCKMFVIQIKHKPSGYLSIEHNKENSGRTKIHKIYLLPESQGTGAGRIIMDFASDQALKMGDKAIYLNVNKYNQAIGFYEHYGFEKKFMEDIDIGGGYLMEDWVMEKSF